MGLMVARLHERSYVLDVRDARQRQKHFTTLDLS
jgi:hypothetical protein